MNKKFEYFILLAIVLAAFSLRLFGAMNVPYVQDEKQKMDLIKAVDSDGDHKHLPLISKVTHNPTGLPYLMTLSMFLFGENRLAVRFPSILLGTLTIFILYFLVKRYINLKTALLCSLFMTFSQFHIGFTRLAEEDGLLMFFVVLILYFVQTALRTRKKIYLILTGLFFGLGLFVKVTIVALLPPVIFYVFFYSKNRGVFHLKDLWIFTLVIGIILSPDIYWNIKNHYMNYRYYLDKIDLVFFSWVPLALFLGEGIVFAVPHYDDAVFHKICSMEYPFMNWYMGLICIFAVIYFLKNKKNTFIVFLLSALCFNFILFMFLRPETGGGYYFHLDNFWWAIIAVVPGFILGSAMLVELSVHYKIMKFILPVIILYFMFNAVTFINFPANGYFPRDSIKVGELHDTARNYNQAGEPGKALKVYRYIAGNFPDYLDRHRMIEKDINLSNEKYE